MKSIELFIEENNKTYTVLIGTNKYENDQIIKDSDQYLIWIDMYDNSKMINIFNLPFGLSILGLFKKK